MARRSSLRYTNRITGKTTKQTEAGQPPTEEALLAMHKFNEELQKAGVLLDLGGLTPTSRACA